MHGPIDYILVGFNDQKFDGSILAALTEAIDDGVVNLLALSVIAKDQDGALDVLDIVNSDDELTVAFVDKYKPDNSIIDQSDIDEMAELLNNGEAAGLLIIEHLWAKPLKKAIIDANGFLLAEGRIHPEAAEEIED